MGQRKAVTKATARRYRAAAKSEEMMAPLRKVWAVLDAPAGKRLAPFLPEIVARLRACGELEIDDELAARLGAMSAATIDRRLAPDRKKLTIKGRSGTKPGSLLKSQIPVRTWADWDDAAPGFVEMDLVGREGEDPRGDFSQSLTVTDLAAGWTEPRAVKNKAQVWVFAALKATRAAMPFPLLGIDSDNGSDFNNNQLLRFCGAEQITFTRSCPGNKNDGAHVEQKNWAVVAPRGRLLPLRHPRRAGPAQCHPRDTAVADQLLLPEAEADQQDPPRRHGDQAVRHCGDPVPAGAGR